MLNQLTLFNRFRIPVWAWMVALLVTSLSSSSVVAIACPQCTEAETESESEPVSEDVEAAQIASFEGRVERTEAHTAAMVPVPFAQRTLMIRIPHRSNRLSGHRWPNGLLAPQRC